MKKINNSFDIAVLFDGCQKTNINISNILIF